MKKSYNIKYNKIKEFEILVFGDNLKFWSFFKMKHWICKEYAHFKNSYLFNNDYKKKMWCIGEHFNVFYNKLPKKSFKNSFACKIIFWEKKHAALFKSNPFGF
jgi:hypothetical protein